MPDDPAADPPQFARGGIIPGGMSSGDHPPAWLDTSYVIPARLARGIHRHGGPDAGWYRPGPDGWQRVSDAEVSEHEDAAHFMSDPNGRHETRRFTVTAGPPSLIVTGGGKHGARVMPVPPEA